MKNFEVAQVSGFWYQRGHSGATSLERLGAKPCSSSSGVTGRRSERVGTLLTLLQSMKRLTSPCGADYLAALQELLQMRSCGNEQVLGSLQQWREEIAVSGLC